jgi:hypothetical protein
MAAFTFTETVKEPAAIFFLPAPILQGENPDFGIVFYGSDLVNIYYRIANW